MCTAGVNGLRLGGDIRVFDPERAVMWNRIKTPLVVDVH